MYYKINELVRRSKNGERQAVEELICCVKPLILKTAKLRCTGQEMEDLLQRGYLIVLETIKTYDEKRNQSYVLYLKKALYYGLSGRAKIIEIPVLNSEACDGIENYELVPDDKVNVEEEVLKDCEYLDLHRAVDMLPDMQREIIKERFFNNKSLKDIAKDMGIPYSKVTKMQYRALKNLKKILTGGK